VVKTSLCAGLVAHFDGQLVEWNLLLLLFFNGFNGFFYLLNYIDPPPSHSRPLSAHPGLGSAKYLEFCGFFFSLHFLK
jgi:hypothetical protein